MKGAKDILTGLLYYPEEAEDMINNAFQRAAQNAIRESRYFYELLGIGKTDGLDEPVRIAAVDKALVFIREIETATNRYESRRARGIFQQHMGVETEIVDLYTGIARDEKLPEPSRMKAAARIIERLVEIGDYERVLALKKRDYVPDASKASITDDVMERAVVNNAAGKDELHLENHVRYPLITMTKGLPIESRNYYGILYVNMLASGSVRDDTLLRAINVGGIHGPEEVEAYLTAKTAEEILTTRPKGILWRCKRSARMKELGILSSSENAKEPFKKLSSLRTRIRVFFSRQGREMEALDSEMQRKFREANVAARQIVERGNAKRARLQPR
jgi:hypothetical protein